MWVYLTLLFLFLRSFHLPLNHSSSSSKKFASLSKLNSRNLKLKPQNSILDSRNHRGSRFKFRIKNVNLPLTSTVDHSNFMSPMAGQNNFFPDPSATFHCYDNSYPGHMYQSYPENSDPFHWHSFSKEQQSQTPRSSSPDHQLCLLKNEAMLEALPSQVKPGRRKTG